MPLHASGGEAKGRERNEAKTATKERSREPHGHQRQERRERPCVGCGGGDPSHDGSLKERKERETKKGPSISKERDSEEWATPQQPRLRVRLSCHSRLS